MNRLLRNFLVVLLMLSVKTGVAAPLGMTLTTLLSLPNQSQTQRQQQRYQSQSLINLEKTSITTHLQASNNLNHLYQLAPLAQYEMQHLLTQAAIYSQTQMSLGDIKQRTRAQEKIKGKLSGDTAQLTDIVRGSLIADSIEDLMQAYQYLDSHGQILQLKNRFATPKQSGYRDLNLLVKLPQTGMIAEIQLHLRQIAEIKNGVEHQVYQEVQGIEFTAHNAKRELTELERARIIRLQQESHKQYHKAWLYYKRMDEQREAA